MAVCTTGVGAGDDSGDLDLATAAGDDAAGSDSVAEMTGGTIVGTFEVATVFALSATISVAGAGNEDVPVFDGGTISDFAGTL